MAKSKLPSPGSGGGSITKGLMSIGKGLARTAGKIYRGLVGPEQAQTYGWTEHFFPAKRKEQRTTKTTTITAPQNLGPVPAMGMDTEEILNLMKENYADEKRYRQVQQSFVEEREGEEEKRHKELVTALKKFTGAKTTATPVAKAEEGGGFLETIMNMFKAFEEKVKGLIEKTVNGILDGIDLLKKADLLGKLMRFLSSPIFRLLSGPTLFVVGSVLGLAYALRKAVELVPDYTKLSPEEARNVLDNGSERDIAALGGRDKLMEIVNGGREGAQKILDTQSELSPEERAKYEKIAGLTIAPKTETELAPVVPKELYVKNSRKNKAAAADWWDKTFGPTHNPDGSPKVKLSAKPLPQGVEPATMESRADYAAGDPRRIDLPQGAAFGVRPHGIKAAPVPPPPTPVAQLTDMNRDLEMYTSPMGDIGGPIIQQSNTQSSQNEPPIPSTATQRDDEPMAAIVFRKQKWRSRAY